MSDRARRVVGWFAVAVSTTLACLWGSWGAVESFHEGWYHRSLAANVAMMFAQYLSPFILFVIVGVSGIRWPAAGAGLHVGAAIVAGWYFRDTSLAVLLPFIVAPLLLIGAAYAWGRPTPRRWAAVVLLGLPLAVVVVVGASPAIRVAGRLDDGYRGPRRLLANGVSLVWAPEGPGWPLDGVSWDEAVRRCRYLDEAGTALADTPHEFWRLPTVEEVVRAQSRRGDNAGGRWDPASGRAVYSVIPDKESPLWNPYSKVISWWTATEVGNDEAYVVVYDGTVRPRPKQARRGYLGFRAVKQIARD